MSVSDESKEYGPRVGGVMEYVYDSARDVFALGCSVSATGLEGLGTLCSACEYRDPEPKSL